MIIVLFVLSQTLIPDFQVNSEDYPGSAGQVFPSIACYDSGGAIIWYDLRPPASGMRVFGTIINAYGDTLNKNLLLSDDTTTGCMSQPAVDSDSSGNFIIVYIQRWNVLARRFNKYGNPYGPSFIVNIDSRCTYPSIKMTAKGKSIITWLNNSELRIYGQILDVNGNPIGTNFLISDSILTGNTFPDVAIKNNGDFIVSWQYNNEIWAQIFDSLGNRIGGNFRLINDPSSTSESYPKLKFDNQSNLFVSWMASVNGQGDINCQIFDSTLIPVTGIIKLDGQDIDTARYQSVAIRDSIWYVVFQNGINAVYLQRIKNNGELIGGNMRISTPFGRRNNNPKIDFTSQYFIITWSRMLAGTACDIMCQKVSFEGNLVSSNYIITDDRGGDPQVYPDVVAESSGNFFVVWADHRWYSDYYIPNCYGRRYNFGGNPFGDEFKINTYANADYPAIGINSNIYLVAWARTLPDSNRQIYAQRFDYNGNSIGENYQISLSAGTNQLSFPKITTLSNNHFVVIWNENINTIDKVYGRILDIMGTPVGNQFNPYVDSAGYNKGGMVVDEGNGKIIVPLCCWAADSITVAIQEFDYQGNKISEPIILNESRASYDFVRGIKGIDRYLFIWSHAGRTKIVGQFLDNNLQKIGSNFTITDDTITLKGQTYSVVSNSSGKFFVIWSELRGDNHNLYGQFFDSSGNRIGNNFRVDNDTTNGEQDLVNCFSANNRIYIVWCDTRILAHWWDIYCKVIAWPDGQEINEDLVINNQILLNVHPNPFHYHCVIKFQIPILNQVQDNDQTNPNYQISLKIYDPTGRMIKTFNLASCIMNRASSIIWDGTDDSGRRLPSGVYFVQFDVGDYTKIEKAVLLK
ncbi:MAG: hypothetical protein N3A65_03565 [candidate division WOR-3 bacterium]|nr:hypothetical protein [candidate division WOR-3 bacterium]